MKSYKYDVVIPTYRSGEVIASLLSSLAIQTHKPSQVIIVLDQEVNQAQYDEYCDYLKHFV